MDGLSPTTTSNNSMDGLSPTTKLLQRRFIRQVPPLPRSVQPASADDSDCLHPKERASIWALASACSELVFDCGELDTQSENGFVACEKALDALELTRSSMKVEPASRSYRQSFTGRYKALFEGEEQCYRVDILEASRGLCKTPFIWANGDQYQVAQEAIEYAEKLLGAWDDLLELLLQWAPPLEGEEKAKSTSFCRFKLRVTLDRLDHAWAGFERTYINEIINVQQRARLLIEEAIVRDERLQKLEIDNNQNELLDMPTYQTELRQFATCIARLNSIANFQGKGRDDLGVAILDSAIHVLMSCKETGESWRAARMVATRVVNSFIAVRKYLREVKHHLDHIHPQLCQNVGLVARLVHWEETWEMGARYIQSFPRLCAVSHLVAHVRQARNTVPELAELCESMDPALFLVIPRIVWLCFLDDPEQCVDLLCGFLPHRFEDGQALCDDRRYFAGSGELRRSRSSPALVAEAQENMPTSRANCTGKNLQALSEQFWRAEVRLEHALSTSASSKTVTPSPIKDQTLAWSILLKRALGSDSDKDPYADLTPTRREQTVNTVEEFMHALEGWSMELQRHEPEEWNEFIKFVMHCLQGSFGDEPRQNDTAFVI